MGCLDGVTMNVRNNTQHAFSVDLGSMAESVEVKVRETPLDYASASIGQAIHVLT